MSEVSTKTIVINADDGWSFRDLVSCHALDLYPLDSGVELFDVVAPDVAEAGRDSRNYQSVIGNFPEDYSSEPDTLLEEMDEIIARLASAGNTGDYLALALVINKADFDVLAGAKDQKSLALSEGASSGFNALMRAMEAVEAQGDADDENVIGRISTRVWFTLVVRNAGANSADLRASEKVYTFARQKRVGVQNIFFLSEGRGQDGLERAHDRHFAKLRMLIDLLNQSHTDTVQKKLRARNVRDFGIDPSRFLWLRSNEHELDILANGDLIRRDLVARFIAFVDRENRDRGKGWQTEFSALKTKLNGVLPGLKDDKRAGDDTSEAYTQQRALDAVITAAKNAQSENRDGISEGLDAEIEIAEISAALGKQRRSWLYSRSAPNRINTLKQEYEAALSHARAVFDFSAAAEIDSLRSEIEMKRKDLHANLNEISLPSTQDALQDLRAYITSVLQESVATSNAEITDTRVKLAKANALSDQVWTDMQSQRDRAKDEVLEAEDRLLRLGSALTVIAIVSLVALLPIMLVPIARLGGTGAPLTAESTFGPMGVVLLFNVGIALVFAMLLARRLARKRNRKLEQLREMMRGHYNDLKLSFAGLLRIAVNRWRLSLLNTAIRFLKPNQGMTAAEPAEQFITKLSGLQSNLDLPRQQLSAKAIESLEVAFRQGKKPAERITSLLIADLPKPDTTPMMKITPGHFGATEFTLPTTASPRELTLKLGAVGDE